MGTGARRSGGGADRDCLLLTDAELRLVSVFEDYVYERGYAPTIAELAAGLNLRSTGTVHEMLERLRAKGVVKGRGRGLRVVR